MRRHLLTISGSRLPLASKCAAAFALPHVGRILDSGVDVLGSAIHQHLRDRNVYGIQEALDRLELVAEQFGLTKDEELLGSFYARCRAFRWVPPRGAVPEKALCLMEDGSVVEVKGGTGHYPDLPEGARVPTQIDLFWAEPDPLYRDTEGKLRCPPNSVLYAIDYKSGKEENVDPVETNMQTLAAAALAAKFTGAKKAMPGIVYIRKTDGIWDLPQRYLDEDGIEKAAALVMKTVDRVNEARKLYAESGDKHLQFTTGTHCKNCAARTDCQGLLGQVRMFLEPGKPAREIALTHAQIVHLAELQPVIMSFANSVRDFLRDYTDAKGEPLKLSNGKLWGPHVVKKDVLDADKTLVALTEEIGEEWAETAMKRTVTVSKASVEEAIGNAHAAQGIVRRKAASMRMTMGRLKGAGGITKRETIEYSVHVPPPAPPPDLEKQLRASLDMGNLIVEGDVDD